MLDYKYMTWQEITSKILEALSFTATITLAVISLYGLKQLTLAKKALNTQSLRDARKLSAEYTYQYLDRVVNFKKRIAVSPSQEKMLEHTHFSPNASTDYLDVKKMRKHDPTLKLGNSKDRKDLINRITVAASPYGELLNELEAFAAVVTSGVLDEPSMYRAVGRNYVQRVKSTKLEEFLKVHNASNHYYINLLELHGLWSKRQEIEDLERNLARAEKKNDDAIKRVKQLKDRVGKIERKTIQSIGVDGSIQ